MPLVTRTEMEIYIDGVLWKKEDLYDKQADEFKRHVEEFRFGYPDWFD